MDLNDSELSSKQSTVIPEAIYMSLLDERESVRLRAESRRLLINLLSILISARMFSRLLLLLAVVGFAAAKIPSYIHVCGLRNPHFDDCIVKSMVALKGKLRDGMPELGIPSVEPLIIDKIMIIDDPKIKVTASNVKLNGLWTFHIKFVHLDTKNMDFIADVLFDTITLNSDYLLKMNILVPIERRGTMSLHSNNMGAKVKAFYSLVPRNNEQYVNFTRISTQLDIKDYTVDFKTDNLNSILQEAINDVLGKNHDEIKHTIQPHIEQAISLKCIELINEIYSHFTYKEIFPDRE